MQVPCLGGGSLLGESNLIPSASVSIPLVPYQLSNFKAPNLGAETELFLESTGSGGSGRAEKSGTTDAHEQGTKKPSVRMADQVSEGGP